MASKASMVPFAFVKLGHQLLQPRRPPWCLRIYFRLSDEVILGANTPPGSGASNSTWNNTTGSSSTSACPASSSRRGCVIATPDPLAGLTLSPAAS